MRHAVIRRFMCGLPAGSTHGGRVAKLWSTSVYAFTLECVLFVMEESNAAAWKVYRGKHNHDLWINLAYNLYVRLQWLIMPTIIFINPFFYKTLTMLYRLMVLLPIWNYNNNTYTYKLECVSHFHVCFRLRHNLRRYSILSIRGGMTAVVPKRNIKEK